MEANAYPRRYIFSRRARLGPFARAFVVVIVGVVIVVAALNMTRFVSLPEDSALPRLLAYFGGFTAFSGGVGVLILIFVTVLDKSEHVVEVDESGLTYHRGGKKPSKRSLKWADVAAYEAQMGRGVFGPGSFLTEPHTSHPGSTDLLGCLIGLVVGLYVSLLEFFIADTSWTVTFKMTGKKRGMSVAGYGPEMEALIDEVARFLPDKRVKPGEGQAAEMNDKGSANET